MKTPTRSSVAATIVAVLIAAPFLLMYARWRSIWIYPGLACLALAAAWRLLWYPRTGYTALIGCGAGVLAGALLGLALTIPAATFFQALKIRPGLLRAAFMFYGGSVGFLLGVFAGYYLHLRKIARQQAGAPQLPLPGQPQK